METVLQVLGGIGSGILVVGAAIYGWFKFFGEKYIAAQLEKNMERYKHDLKKEMVEHEVRYKLLFDKVSTTMIALFEKVNKAFEKVSRQISIIDFSGEPDKAGKFREFADAYNEASHFLFDNRLLFPVDVFNITRDFMNRIRKVGNDFNIGVQREKHGTFDRDYWDKAEQAIPEMNAEYEKLHRLLQEKLGIF